MAWLRRLLAALAAVKTPALPPTESASQARVGLDGGCVALTIGTCVTTMTPDQARALAAGLVRWATKADRVRGAS